MSTPAELEAWEARWPLRNCRPAMCGRALRAACASFGVVAADGTVPYWAAWAYYVVSLPVGTPGIDATRIKAVVAAAHSDKVHDAVLAAYEAVGGEAARAYVRSLPEEP